MTRRTKNLVAWVQERPNAPARVSLVHIAKGSRGAAANALLCGFKVPNDDRSSGGILRGRDEIDDVDPHLASCQVCADLEKIPVAKTREALEREARRQETIDVLEGRS